MKRKTPALWAKIISWILSLVMVISMLGGMGLMAMQSLLTDAALHERVALNEEVIDAQMLKINSRVEELAQQHHFKPETVMDIVSREAVAQYGREVVDWWMGMFRAEPDTMIPEFEVADIQAAVRADELFKEHTAESLRLRIARDEVAYEVGMAVKDAVLPIRTSLVELAVPVVLSRVDMARVMELLDMAKKVLLGLWVALAVLMLLICRGPAGAVYAGGAVAAAGLLMIPGVLGMMLLELPRMIQPLSEMLSAQVRLLGNEMARDLLMKSGVMILAGQVLASCSLSMLRRPERKREA